MQLAHPIKEDFLMSRKNDYVFKRLFGDENNKDLLISLLNSILNETIVDVQLLNPEFLIEALEEKLGILDIKARTSTGSLIDIEIQLNRTTAFEKRILYYWSKLYSGVLKKGISYDKLEKTISICIIDYLRFTDESLHHRFTIYDPEAKILLTDVLEIHFLELRKLEYIDVNDVSTITWDQLTPMQAWMVFIATDDREVLKMLSEKNKEIKKAYDLLEVMSQSEVDRRAYEAREASLHLEVTIREEGIEEGREKGKLEERTHLIKALLSNGMSPEEVSKMTSISLDEVHRINGL